MLRLSKRVLDLLSVAEPSPDSCPFLAFVRTIISEPLPLALPRRREQEGELVFPDTPSQLVRCSSPPTI
jgi:hypothetical protein